MTFPLEGIAAKDERQVSRCAADPIGLDPCGDVIDAVRFGSGGLRWLSVNSGAGNGEPDGPSVSLVPPFRCCRQQFNGGSRVAVVRNVIEDQIDDSRFGQFVLNDNESPCV